MIWISVLASAVGGLWLACLAGALLAGLVLSPRLIRNWLIVRDLREVGDALPGHAQGPVTASGRDRRRLHRDLVLLLVVNADGADADEDA